MPPITLDDVRELQAQQSSPSVTITLPTHRTSPDNQKDPIRLKNLVSEVVGRLEEAHGARPVRDIVARIHELADGVDHEHNREGMVLVANADYGDVLRVPFRLPERAVVDDNFLTRDIVNAVHRSPLYWVLVLSEDPTRLYLGQRDDLTEVTAAGFPLQHSGPGGQTALQQGVGANPSQERDRALQAFMREVDEALTTAMRGSDHPVVVVGLDRNLAAFDAQTGHDDAIIARIEGGYDRMPAHELGDLVWSHTREAFSAKRHEVVERVGAATGQGRVVSDLNDCWQAALDARVDTMVVAGDHHQAVTVSDDRRTVTPVDAAPEGVDAGHEDAVDEMVEMVMASGGDVVFVDEGALGDLGPIAMITRF